MRLQIGEDLRTVRADVDVLGGFARRKNSVPAMFRPSFGDGSAGGDAGDKALFPVNLVIRGDDPFLEGIVFCGRSVALCADGRHGQYQQC